LRTALDNVRLRRADARHAAVSALIGSDLGDSISLPQLAKRPKVTANLIASLLPAELKPVAEADLNSVLADSLYAGYLDTQRAAADAASQPAWPAPITITWNTSSNDMTTSQYKTSRKSPTEYLPSLSLQ
jgi:tRNA U34 5-carboxymethylaminomethyl modifying enzyme MnmG/GidA